MRMAFLAGACAVLILAGTALAAGGSSIQLQILQSGLPVTGAHVAVYLSCDKVEGTTGKNGQVALETGCAGGFYWVEIDGQRVDTLFPVETVVRMIDVDQVHFMTWEGGR